MPTVHEDRRRTVEYWQRTSYTTIQRRGLLKEEAPDLAYAPEVRARLAVIDRRVHEIYGSELRTWLGQLGDNISILELDASEPKKNRDTMDLIHQAALDLRLSRRDELVAVGGGVTLDLVGFAAAELRKETQYIAVPTTLVGAVDAGPAVKRAINFRGKKNFVGDYHPPRLVLIDPDFLLTLNPDHVRAGLAEMKKVAEMIDRNLFDLLKEHGESFVRANFAGEMGSEAIWRSTSGIVSHIERDPKEANLRRWPDHGHTVSPRLEEETGMPHGLTVSVCSSLSATVAFLLGALSESDLQEMLDLAGTLELPIWHPRLADRDFLESALASTALVRGGRHLPVPTSIGAHCYIEPELQTFIDAANWLRQRTPD